MPDFGEQITVQAVATWPDDVNADARIVNQLLVTQGLGLGNDTPDATLYLTLGHAAMPVNFAPERLIDGPGESKSLPVPVVPVASAVLTLGRARELYNLLGDVLRAVDPEMQDGGGEQ